MIALRLDERAALGERAADVGEPAPVRADEQLAHRRVRRRGVGERAVDRVVAADPLLAADEQLRLGRAVRGDRVEVDVAAVLDREDEAAAVPERLADLRVCVHLPVERCREQGVAGAVGVHHADLAVVREGAVLDLVAVGDARPVRRERRHRARPVVAGELPRLAAVRVDDVQMVDQVEVPAVAAQRAEDDLLAVRRPRGLAVLAVAVGDLPGLAAVEVDDEDVLAAVGRPADVVELVEEARQPSRRALLVVLFLVRLVAHAHRVREPRGVGRPDDVLDALLRLGQGARLAAFRRDDVELRRRLLGSAVRREREPAAVRRPAGRTVPLVAEGEPARLGGAVERRHPDRPAVLARLAVDRPDLVRDARPVRGDARVGDPGQLVDVVGPHAVHEAGVYGSARPGRDAYAGERTRTSKEPELQRDLNPPRLPVPPHPRASSG